MFYVLDTMLALPTVVIAIAVLAFWTLIALAVHRIIVRENSASPAESAHLAIDRAASAVGRYLRRTKSDLILPRGADAESPHQEQP